MDLGMTDVAFQSTLSVRRATETVNQLVALV